MFFHSFNSIHYLFFYLSWVQEKHELKYGSMGWPEESDKKSVWFVPKSGIWFPQQLTDIYRIFQTKTGKANWSKVNPIARFKFR